MGYDRQRSPFATRLFLSCYFLLLLVNILLYSNKILPKDQLQTLVFAFLSLLMFSISFYGLWFANLLILFFTALLFSILFITSFTSLVFFALHIPPDLSPVYFAHNYLWLSSTCSYAVRCVSLIGSCLLNVIGLYGVCHLCSCIEHRQQSWPYRKRTVTIVSHTML